MLNDLNIKKEYLPNSGEPSEVFFRKVIGEASFYRRAAGFFSSSVLNLFNKEILEFAKKSGKIDLICSNQLPKEDIKIIHEINFTNSVDQNIIVQIEHLEKDSMTNNALAFFATLVKNKILSIKIAKYSTGGLFHDKTGCFYDNSQNLVTFRGSSNETFMGWSKYGNFETLETFCSWKPEDLERIENHHKYLFP